MSRETATKADSDPRSVTLSTLKGVNIVRAQGRCQRLVCVWCLTSHGRLAPHLPSPCGLRGLTCVMRRFLESRVKGISPCPPQIGRAHV